MAILERLLWALVAVAFVRSYLCRVVRTIVNINMSCLQDQKKWPRGEVAIVETGIKTISECMNCLPGPKDWLLY